MKKIISIYILILFTLILSSCSLFNKEPSYLKDIKWEKSNFIFSLNIEKSSDIILKWFTWWINDPLWKYLLSSKWVAISWIYDLDEHTSSKSKEILIPDFDLNFLATDYIGNDLKNALNSSKEDLAKQVEIELKEAWNIINLNPENMAWIIGVTIRKNLEDFKKIYWDTISEITNNINYSSNNINIFNNLSNLWWNIDDNNEYKELIEKLKPDFDKYMFLWFIDTEKTIKPYLNLIKQGLEINESKILKDFWINSNNISLIKISEYLEKADYLWVYVSREDTEEWEINIKWKIIINNKEFNENKLKESYLNIDSLINIWIKEIISDYWKKIETNLNVENKKDNTYYEELFLKEILDSFQIYTNKPWNDLYIIFSFKFSKENIDKRYDYIINDIISR